MAKSSISKYLTITLEDCGLQKIIFNKPHRKNALDPQMILSITALLRDSAENPDIKFTTFSGEGDYFTSGNDLSNFLESSVPKQLVDGKEEAVGNPLEAGIKMFKELVAAFINYPKPLVAIVNGPAIGMGVTMLAHFDLVFATSTATFYCPFVTLGQTPEGCSSFLFPLLMGHSKAAKMLLFGSKISAEEAFQNNLVTEVVDPNSLPQVWDRIRGLCSLPPNTMRNAKELMKRRWTSYLHQINNEECDVLRTQWTSEEFLDSLMKFMSRKSKL